MAWDIRDKLNKGLSVVAAGMSATLSFYGSGMIFGLFGIGQIPAGSLVSVFNLAAPAIPFISAIIAFVVLIYVFEYTSKKLEKLMPFKSASKGEKQTIEKSKEEVEFKNKKQEANLKEASQEVSNEKENKNEKKDKDEINQKKADFFKDLSATKIESEKKEKPTKKKKNNKEVLSKSPQNTQNSIKNKKELA